MNLFNKYKEFVLYVFFGGCTTLVNITSYFLATRMLDFSIISGAVTAWVLSVLFAYITNKIWVFERKDSKEIIVLTELIAFISCRIFSGILDLGIMVLFVDIIGLNDMVIKVISNIVVVIINYVFSKFYIFK